MKHLITKSVIVTTVALSLTACASHPDKIAAASVSPVQHQSYSCRQLEAEVHRVNDKMIDLYHSLDRTADNDTAQMAVGMVLFWPALFFLEGGDGAEAAEYARLKGELDALETVAVRKNCGIVFPAAPAAKTAPAETAVPSRRHD